jgi:hypothetical protein
MPRILLVLTLAIVMTTLAVADQGTVIAPRSQAVLKEFKLRTGFPHGRPGWVIDHKIPRCAGGPDVVANLIWQRQAESYRKDVFERALCAALKQQGYVLMREGTGTGDADGAR